MLDCALEDNRLCQLTMANKHLHGIDGILVDPEQAYGTQYFAFLTFTILFLVIYTVSILYSDIIILYDLQFTSKLLLTKLGKTEKNIAKLT